MPAVEVTGLTVRYGPVTAVDRISFTAEAGQVTALPAAALADAMTGALAAGASVPSRAWLVLALWAFVAPVAAALTFRWE